MNNKAPSLSITETSGVSLDMIQRLSLALASLGVLGLLISIPVNHATHPGIWLTISILAIVIGTTTYARQTYLLQPAGVKNDGVWFSTLTARGAMAWAIGFLLTGFYVLLYFQPERLGLGVDGGPNSGIVRLFDPLSLALNGKPASQWFMYGALYTLAILVMGYKFILKNRHSRYQIFRTISVMFFQLGFAFLIPELLSRWNLPYNDLKNMWPLNYYFFDEWHVNGLIESGGAGSLMLMFGVAMIFVISPLLTYFYGKRWYCSWVCGCGGLAETAGDPFRQLSDKSIKAWKVERWLVHSVLVCAVIMTVALVYGYLGKDPSGFWVTRGMFAGLVLLLASGSLLIASVRPAMLRELKAVPRGMIITILVLFIGFVVHAYLTGRSDVFFVENHSLRKWYGFYIGAIFSGVIGVGFYPILGSRVWCRFGCPMAAVLGLQQRFLSRFRITSNGGQCISCGNCSTYCEMGIDVRSYAQRGENIVRASCVGCGVCANVCPRGVLKLESGKLKGRTGRGPLEIGKKGIELHP